MKKTRDFTRSQVERIMQAQANVLAEAHVAFATAHIPRFHQLLMVVFPFMRSVFDYTLRSEPGDSRKLTLTRRGKIVARNF